MPTFLDQIIPWAVTILVIRMLKPEDNGLIAMAFMNFFGLLNETGVGVFADYIVSGL